MIERGTREPLETIEIAVSGTPVTVYTDADGKFSARVPIGKHTVRASDSSHRPDAVNVEVTETEIQTITFYLKPNKTDPYETIVKGKREETVVARRTLQREQLRTIPGTFGDPLRVLETLPGVARAPFGLGILIVRGAGPADSGVFIDGVQIPLLYHFLGGPSILNPEFLDHIDFYPGGFPTSYGRLQGGVIDVATREGTSAKKLHGAVNLNLIDSSFYVDTKIGKNARLALAGRRSYIDLVLALVLPSSTLTVAPVYYDYQTRLDWHVSKTDKLSVMLFGSDDYLTVVRTKEGRKQGSSIDISSHIGFHRLSARWLHQLMPHVDLSFAPSIGYDLVNFSAGGTTGADVGNYDWNLREQLDARPRKDLSIKAGLDMSSRFTVYDVSIPLPADYRVFGESANPIIITEHRLVNNFGVGLYGEGTWDATQKLRVVPGVRADLYTFEGQNRQSVDPRLTVRYALTGATAVKAQAGQFHQPPQAEQLDWKYGQPKLGIEVANQYSAGVEHAFNKLFNIDVQGYFVNRRDQAIPSVKTTVTNGEVVPERYCNCGRGRTYGAELLFKRELTRHLFGWLSYTLSYTETKRPQDATFHRTFLDQTHNLIGVASYTLDSGWELGAKLQVTSGNATTPVQAATYNSDTNLYQPIRGELNSARDPTYVSLDVRAEKTWTFESWRLSAFLDVKNLTNSVNPEFKQYDYRYRQSGYIRGVPIFPSFGVRGVF